MSCEIGSTAHSPAASTAAKSPQKARVKANTDRIDMTAKTQMPCVRTEAGSPLSDRNDAVQRRHGRVLTEGNAQHPERVVDQQAALRGDLVGVEQVLGPVVARDRVAADDALLEQGAGGQRQAEAARDGEIGAREPAPGLGPGKQQAGDDEPGQGEPHDRPVQGRTRAREGDEEHRRCREPERRGRRQHRHGTRAHARG